MNIRAEATTDATELLEEVWASAFGFDIPIDPINIAQSLGIGVYLANLDSGVGGLLVKKAGQDPAIYLNKTDSENRQRFTAAHELGHYVHRSGGDDEAWEYIDRRDQLSSEGTDPEERYANSFAAQLLMPENEVRSYAKRLSAPALAITFNVSLEAMKNRLVALRINA